MDWNFLLELLLASSVASGATISLLHVALRVSQEYRQLEMKKKFSYYDIFDATFSTLKGGFLGLIAITTAPISIPFFLWLKHLREHED